METAKQTLNRAWLRKDLERMVAALETAKSELTADVAKMGPEYVSRWIDKHVKTDRYANVAAHVLNMLSAGTSQPDIASYLQERVNTEVGYIIPDQAGSCVATAVYRVQALAAVLDLVNGYIRSGANK